MFGSTLLGLDDVVGNSSIVGEIDRWIDRYIGADGLWLAIQEQPRGGSIASVHGSILPLWQIHDPASWAGSGGVVFTSDGQVWKVVGHKRNENVPGLGAGGEKGEGRRTKDVKDLSEWLKGNPHIRAKGNVCFGGIYPQHD